MFYIKTKIIKLVTCTTDGFKTCGEHRVLIELYDCASPTKKEHLPHANLAL